MCFASIPQSGNPRLFFGVATFLRIAQSSEWGSQYSCCARCSHSFPGERSPFHPPRPADRRTAPILAAVTDNSTSETGRGPGARQSGGVCYRVTRHFSACACQAGPLRSSSACGTFHRAGKTPRRSGVSAKSAPRPGEGHKSWGHPAPVHHQT